MESAKRIWGPPTEDCRLSISLPAREIRSDDPVELTLVFRNDGKTIVRFPRRSQWFDYEFTVSDTAGNEIPLTPFGKQLKDSLGEQGGTLLEVAPEQELASTVEISRLYDLSRPGKYVIEAQKELQSRSGRGFIKVISNKVELTIVQK